MSGNRQSTVSKGQDGQGPGHTRINKNEMKVDTDAVEAAWSKIDGPLSRTVTAIVIGCGQRGYNYSYFAADFPARMKVVAVAEPKANRRKAMIERFGLEEDVTAVADWKDLASRDKLADCAFITTQDRMHLEPAVALAKKGYHLLLEKPMSVDEKECDEMCKVFQDKGVIVAVCHVLRYFPPCAKIRQVIDSGVLGDVVAITHMENVLFWHFAHSFVRGNWRKEEESSFSLLAKCCHDIDLIMYWMGDKKCTKIQSMGGLYHFKKSQAPEGSTDRCFGCPAEEKCPYSVQKIYLDASAGYPHWPMSAVCDIEDDPRGYKVALEEALKTGPYGRCVYQCDNDVCDHQVVTMEFEGGATASMTMNAFTRNMCRETKVSGTKGELRWDGSDHGGMFLYDFATGTETEVKIDMIAPPVRTRGHGGADFFLVNAFLKAVATGDRSHVKTGIVDSLRSHKLVFAAEKARKNNSVETVDI